MDGNNFKNNSTFILEQFSEESVVLKYLTLSETMNQDAAIEANNEGAPLYTKNVETSIYERVPKENIVLSTEANTVYYTPSEVVIPTYQILRDVSRGYNNSSFGKPDKNISNTDKSEVKHFQLNHIGKTFIRKGIAKYTLIRGRTGETGSPYAKNYYTWDEGSKKFIDAGSRDNISNSYNLFEKEMVWWTSPTNNNVSSTEPAVTIYLSPWIDESEHYTGYLGNLNATGYNHVDAPFDKNYKTDPKTKAFLHKDNNGKAYLTLVDAINNLDKVIGSTNKRFGGTASGQTVSTDDEGWNINTDGSKLKEDIRPVNIKEDNLADAIVRHDADIGSIEDWNNESTPNIKFIKSKNINLSTKTVGNNTKTEINSLTDAVKFLDKMLGDYSLLDDDFGLRPVHTPNNKEDFTFAEAIQHQNADIGKIEELTSPTYTPNNFTFDEEQEQNIGNIESASLAHKIDEVELDKQIPANSLRDMVAILDKAIGKISSLSSTNKLDELGDLVTVLNSLDNKIIGEKTELHNKDADGFNDLYKNGDNTIIKVLNQLDSYIGTIITLTEDTNDIHQTNLVEVVNQLNALLGEISKIDSSKNEINKTTIVDTINRINDLLGNLKKFNTDNILKILKEEDNTPENLKLNLVNAILRLSKVIGNWGTNNTYTWTAKPDYDRVKDFEPKNYNSIIEYLDVVDEWLKQLQETKLNKTTFDNWIKLINNLAENMDILDSNVNFIMDKIKDGDLDSGGSSSGPTLPGGNTSSTNTSLYWGSF